MAFVGGATQTGKAVGALQDLLPHARVLYSSATGASEPNNLGYMYRLGAAGFDHMKDMIDTLNRYFVADVLEVPVCKKSACRYKVSPCQPCVEHNSA